MADRRAMTTTHTVPRITLAQLREWRPCPDYTDERIAELFAGRESLTPAETAALDIPRADVVWVWTRPGALPDDVRDRWMERIVTRAVETHALTCGVDAVERWAQRWLSGEDRSKESARAAVDAATDAAWLAVDAAAANAARAAADAANAARANAARAAADAANAARAAADAAWLAADAAAWLAADAATAAAAAWLAVDAADDTERARQVSDLLAVVDEVCVEAEPPAVQADVEETR